MQISRIGAAAVLLWLPPGISTSEPDHDTDVGSFSDHFGVSVDGHASGGSSASSSDSANTHVTSFTGSFGDGLAGTSLCIGTAIGGSDDTCPDAEAADEPQLTLGMVRSAFEQVPLPPSRLVVQPPDGTTLVNFDTNFYTESEGFLRTVTLLGQRVDLDITPARFTWRFGDGRSRSTATPGSPYPRLDVTHAYLRKGRVRASVDTTYTAQFRVNGGPWQPVPGSVTIAGTSVPLRVVTATPQLVAY